MASPLEVWIANIFSWFEVFIVFIVFISTVLLIIYDYNDRDNSTAYNQAINIAENVVNGIFILECFLKIIAMGFFMQKNSYLRYFWHWLDLILAIQG